MPNIFNTLISKLSCFKTYFRKSLVLADTKIQCIISLSIVAKRQQTEFIFPEVIDLIIITNGERSVKSSKVILVIPDEISFDRRNAILLLHLHAGLRTSIKVYLTSLISSCFNSLQIIGTNLSQRLSLSKNRNRN